MATEGQILNYLLAWDIADRHGLTPEDVLSKARGHYGKTERTRPGQEWTEDDVQEIYDLYPTRDPANNNRPLQKGEGAKRIIRQLLSKRPKEGVKRAVTDYLNKKRESGQWIGNFTTALNNLEFDDPGDDPGGIFSDAYQ